jgi:hypothetical protein
VLTFTTCVLPAFTNEVPSLYHVFVNTPPVEADGVAVSVVVIPGNNEMPGDADNPTVGNCLTVSMDAFELAGAEQVALDTCALNLFPFIAVVVVVTVYVDEFAPAIFVQVAPPSVLICHW